MHVIKRTWSDGSDYFYELCYKATHADRYPGVKDPAIAEMLAIGSAPDARAWIEAHATIVDTLPAVTEPPSMWKDPE